MTKGKIQIIVSFMCIALMGLVGLQWYWINEAKTIRNDQFNQKVAESVQEVIHRLEKQEIIYLLQRRIESEQQKTKLDRITKLRNTPLNSKKNIPAQAKPETPKAALYQIFIAPNGEEIQYQISKEAVPTDVLSPNLRIIADFQQQVIEEFFEAQRYGVAGMDEFMRRRMDDEKKLGKAFSEAFSGNQKQPLQKQSAPHQKTNVSPKATQQIKATEEPDRVSLLRDVMKDMMYTKRPIGERVNRFLLDTLLRKEFSEHGITIPFEFAVRENDNNYLLFSTTNKNSNDWQSNAYQASLFPNETASKKNLLMVYFPDQEKYILSNMGILFGGSGLLILVVMACFYMSVSTIIRQKKLADIKNDFINNMTHELKTPISTIALATDMAQENSASQLNPERITRYLGIIENENKRLSIHVEKVLQMAMLDEGVIKLINTPVNLHEQIINDLNSMAIQIENQNGQVAIDFEATNMMVAGDEVHLSNIFKNLIDNAIKYSPEELAIKITTKNENNGFILEIEDRGLGMKKEQLERIFETFYRIPTGNVHDVKGFGLGLSYVKKMIEAHHGSIKVTSTLGVGSKFSVWFPLMK